MKKPAAVLARWPWDQVALSVAEVSALKAISDQAFAAIEKVAGVELMSFAHGGEDGRRATDFAEGKRWVARTLKRVREMSMPVKRPAETGPHAVPKGAPPGE